MKSKLTMATLMAAATAMSLVACANEQETGDDATAPTLETDTLGVQQTVTCSAGTCSGFTIASARPQGNAGTMTQHGSFTLSGGTTKAGVCLVNQVWTGGFNAAHTVTCSTKADCSSYNPDPVNGDAYCGAPDNSGQPTCWIRPGSQSSWCAGSPAISGNPAVGAGTYTTPDQAAFGTNVSSSTFCSWNGSSYVCQTSSIWMSLGCFSGCTGVGGAPTTASFSPYLQAYNVNGSQGYAP